MPVDRLATLLQRFSVSAEVFHSGALCGIADFAPQEGRGQLHLLRRGPVRVEHAHRAALQMDEPSLLLYPRPLWHRFVCDADVGADLACAFVRFDIGGGSPLAAALPELLHLPLAALPDCGSVLDALFDEAFAERCGRQHVVDRLFEVVLVKLLRYAMDQGRLQGGLLAGLGRPRLARVLTALHEEPQRPWTLESMAALAGMSRSAFAREFHAAVGQPPGDYLLGWRLLLVQQRLRAGESLKRIASGIGYASEAALSRAFAARFGRSPRAWLREQR